MAQTRKPRGKYTRVVLPKLVDPPKRESQQELLLQHGYLLPSDAAQRAGVNMSTIYRMIKQGKIEAVRVGQYSYVVAKSLAAYYSEVKLLRDRILAGVIE